MPRIGADGATIGGEVERAGEQSTAQRLRSCRNTPRASIPRGPARPPTAAPGAPI